MKPIQKLLVALGATLALAALAAPEVGKPAPDFKLTDLQGRHHTLASFAGKTVVLEWVNPECPFVVKHYDKSGNLPATQKAATADGVVWVSINSAAPGKQGDFDQAAVEAWMKRVGATPTAYCRDPEGTVGKAYDARTTPHLFVIDPQGVLVYAGGIDDIRSANPDDIAKATNYVKAALADLKAGREVQVKTSRPYGCSVKYAD